MNRAITMVASALLLCMGAAAHADPKPSLAQARVDAAAKVYAALQKSAETGGESVEHLCEWSERWYVAQRELPLTGAALATAADDNLARIDALAKNVDRLVRAGAAGSTDAAIVAYYRAEAAMWAAQAHGKAP